MFNITNLIHSQPLLTVSENFNALEGITTTGNGLGNQRLVSNRYIEDGSFFRMDNLSVGYNFNTSNVEWINKARLYMQVQNVFLISGYSGPDPEVFAIDPSFGSGIQSQGYDYNIYPKSRLITLGAQLFF